MKMNLRQNKGITLIALVITIIVLLILVGVTIVSLTGENGLLERAANAGKDTEEATEKEKLQIEVLASFDTDGHLNMSALKSNINSHISGATADDTTEFPLTIKYTATENEYKIDEHGNVEKTKVTDRTGINVGDYIDYSPGSGWRVLRIYDNGKIDIIRGISGTFGNGNSTESLNNYCRQNYSNSEHEIYARSVNKDDFEVEGRR